MSGIKSIQHTIFYRRIHFRGVTADTLAEKIASGRTHVTEVLNGTKDSPRTWRRLARFLKPEELRILGRDRRGDRLPDVPHETKSQERLYASCATAGGSN